ncbi:hypothetical protein EON65_10860 [archaeon]|nr:MAG: hypothetical protein EON65_10860 [archaeon]
MTNLFAGKSSESPAKAALFGSVVLATASYFAYSFFSPSNTPSDLAPALTEDEAREMMKAILDRTKTNVPRLLKAAENFKQQIAAQGQEVDDMQLLKALILPHLETGIKEIQEEVLNEFDADDDELEEAVNYYLEQGDEELADLTKSLKVIYKQFGGDLMDEEIAGPSKEFELHEVVELFHELVSKIIEQTETMVKKYVKENGVPTTALQKQDFQTELHNVTDTAEKVLLAERGLTTSDIQQLLLKYQTEPAIQQAFMSMQFQTQRILQTHGISM